MRDDILLDSGGDIKINDNGDLQLTESIRQSVQIRLRWFFAEWRFAPERGVPWFEDVFIKNPNDARIRQVIQEECMQVEGVLNAKNIKISNNITTRVAVISLIIVTTETIYNEEVSINI